MQVIKPKVKKVRVLAQDAETRKTVCMTVYDSTPQEVIDFLIRSLQAPKPRKATA